MFAGAKKINEAVGIPVIYIGGVESIQDMKTAMEAGFDPVAVGQLYDVPLKALPQQRDIFSQLKDFSDVRAFYDKELAEKGHPEVEG